ncbi:hypothetical protein J1605_022862 [Eschrichtius robustus]|uniref:Uncharacterized protein n=1 Tax=Eschrichtius robustus TaxID=9764 RepID=A0AB34H447_ESCRO|nr:hypothetical protein J1605_022862 [Eschrichtius robustus]
MIWFQTWYSQGLGQPCARPQPCPAIQEGLKVTRDWPQVGPRVASWESRNEEAGPAGVRAGRCQMGASKARPKPRNGARQRLLRCPEDERTASRWGLTP